MVMMLAVEFRCLELGRSVIPGVIRVIGDNRPPLPLLPGRSPLLVDMRLK